MGKPLKVMQILPEFHEGGVERHVLWLSNEMAKKGHEVLVVTKGGKLESHLDERVGVWHLPCAKPRHGFCAMRVPGELKRRLGYQRPFAVLFDRPVGKQ